MNEYTQSILGSTLRSKRRDGTIEGCAQKANGVNNIGIAQAYYPDSSLIGHPVVLELLDSISQIYVALTNDVTALPHDDCLPT
jgi:hypothetical protein